MLNAQLAATVVIVRNHSEYGIQVLTQTRQVINKDYDPLYDGVEEVVGETVEPGETVFQAALRGCREELGRPDFEPMHIFGNTGYSIKTRPEDEIYALKPYMFHQIVKGPQPWVAVVFVIQVAEDFEPNLDIEGEVSKHTWHNLSTLIDLLYDYPNKFGFEFPVLRAVCEDLRKYKLVLM